MSSQKIAKVTLKMDASIKRQLDEYCKKHGLKMYFVVTQAIREYLERHGA